MKTSLITVTIAAAELGGTEIIDTGPTDTTAEGQIEVINGLIAQGVVAIARARSIDARVVIMDEPTAALSHKEIEELYTLAEPLKAQGKAILFISHAFDETFRITDNHTAFRDGQFIAAGWIADVDNDTLV